MVLVAESKDSTSPEARAMAAVWNHVHSIPSRFAGLRLAVLLQQPPPPTTTLHQEEGGPVAVAWLVPRGANYESRLVRIGFSRFAEVAATLDLRDVLLAEPEVPRDVLERIGFCREISASQVTGFWFDRGERISLEEPGYFPSMAVVPATGRPVTEAPCVFAVAVDWVWYPLSEAAVYTYSHASELVGGREGIFIRQGASWPEHDRPSPETVFRVKHADFLEARDVGHEYGDDVARRARTGARIMLVTLTASDARPK